MNEVIRINFRKLKFIYIFFSTLFTIVALILLLVAAMSNQFPETRLILYILIGSSVILPVFTSIVAITAWFVNYRQNKSFFKPVYKGHLLPIGFTIEIIDIDSKWKFADEVFKLVIDDQTIICTRDKYKKSNIEFQYLRNVDPLNPLIVKRINLKRSKLLKMQIQNLKSELLKNAFV